MASSCMVLADKVVCRASWGWVDRLGLVVLGPHPTLDRVVRRRRRRPTSHMPPRMSPLVPVEVHLSSRVGKVKVNRRVRAKVQLVKEDPKDRVSMVEIGLGAV